MQSPPEMIREEEGEESGMGEAGALETDHGAVGGASEEKSGLLTGRESHRRRTLSSSRRRSKIDAPPLKNCSGKGEAGAPDTTPGPEGAPGTDDLPPGQDYPRSTPSNDLNRHSSGSMSHKAQSSDSEWWKRLSKKSVICGILVISLIITVIFLYVKMDNAPVCKCSSCPNKWTKYDDLCYFVSKNSTIWKESRQYCEKEGGSLLILNDTVQQQIEELVLLRNDHWIGLQKDPGSQEWKWVNGSIYSGSVRDGKDLRMNCAYINDGIGALDCSSQRPWICMKAL
ncbi:killer cell lectin-like receptor subfamily G member 1 [Rana temporaria]|uniref:killer cell lectin-like receptor subfamily G member 1 n=1 Tax=Rana temporaria TaxID=8407 RepID=UPI001AAD460A|nr:killer cell lectin-like receptor subfamily G member 1 [Rana temporaria]